MYVLTLATGAGTAFMFPAYQVLIPEVVPKKDLMNAIALNSAQFNGARMIGLAVVLRAPAFWQPYLWLPC